MLNPTFPLALTAGLLSFLSPCVLPLVPSYLAYLGGDSQEKGRIIRNSLLFVLGFSMVFIALGASASFLGQILLQNRTWLMQAAGIIVIKIGRASCRERRDGTVGGESVQHARSVKCIRW